MARLINKPADADTPPKAGQGHNRPPLTDDEFADLQAYYTQKIQAQQKKAAAKKAEYDIERGEVSALFKLLNADLKISRKDFEAYLVDLALPEAEFQAKEAKRARLYTNGGLDPNGQYLLDLPDTVDEQNAARAEGKRAYLRGEDPIPPKHVSPVVSPNWLEGWHEGQAETAERMGRAEALIEARKPAVSEPDADEDQTDIEEFDEVAEARRLKNTSFMDRGTPAPDAEGADAA